MTERVDRWLDMVGLDPVTPGERLVITGACGHAGASTAWARRALTISAQVAANLS